MVQTMLDHWFVGNSPVYCLHRKLQLFLKKIKLCNAANLRKIIGQQEVPTLHVFLLFYFMLLVNSMNEVEKQSTQE